MPFPVSRPVVFPLFGVTAEGKCACGNLECSRVGKHPRVAWGDLEFGHEVPTPEPGAGAGLKTGAHPKGSDVFVVDLDGDAALEAWEALGPEDARTFCVATPRGWHLYFRHPGFHVKTCAGELGKGIDIRGDGGFVVAPGSPHRSGGTYEILDDVPVADAPAWLLAWLRSQRAPTEAQNYPGDVTDPEEKARRRALYAEYLEGADTPVRGPERRGQGDQILFEVVQRGAYDLALPVEDVLELVRKHYDPRCSPQWGPELEERVHHKAHDAKTTSTRPRMDPLPEDLAHLAQAGILETYRDTFEKLAEHERENPPDEDDPLEKDLKITWGGWDTPLLPPVYMIAPIIPEATLGVIVAKGSSLKTWLVLSMLSSVARGEPWLGKFPAVSCPTLLVDFESGRDIIQERMQYLKLGDTKNLGHASFPNARIDDPNFWIKLAKIVIRRGIRFVAIDSFAAGATGVEENEAKAADPLHFAARFIEATKCTVLLIHHAKKGDGGDERDLMRGSGAIYGAADWAYTMIPQDEDRTKMIVRCIKAFRRKPDDFGVVLTADGLELDASEPTENDEARAEELKRAILGALARGPIATKHDIDKAVGKKNGTCSAEIEAMILRREIVKLPRRGYTLDNPVARLGRVRSACRVPGLSTPGALASASHVDVEEIHELLAEGKLFKSGTGWVIP